jgi:hypothetical protein
MKLFQPEESFTGERRAPVGYRPEEPQTAKPFACNARREATFTPEVASFGVKAVGSFCRA